MAPGAPASSASFLPEGLLHDLLAVSLTGFNVLRPVYDAEGELIDFALEYLNPAAQRMAGLAERPGGTLLTTRFPHTIAAGVLGYYRRVYEAGATGLHEVNYQADGLDNYFRLAARRSGDWLVVSFTDTSDQDRSAVEVALRDSQAREQQARVEAEAAHQRFRDVLLQLPAQVALNRGPDHVFELVNPRYQQLFPTRPIQGLPVRQALPELAGQQFFELLDHVYQTGEPFYGREMPASMDYTNSGRLERRYVEVFFQALRDAHGSVDGVLNFSYDVTEQVLARQQVQQLNQELEARVQERTQQLEAALHAAERHQVELTTFFEQAPVAIAIFRGPTHTIELANELQLAIWGYPREQALGKDFFELLPELAGQGFEERLAGVLATGQPYVGTDEPASFVRQGVRENVFVSFVYAPLREADGRISGVVVVVTNTTEQVRARQQADALQAELLDAARAQAQARADFYQVFELAPAAVCLLRGPAHRFEYVNPAFQQLSAGRPLLGLDYAAALPEAAAHGFAALLDHTYQTGEPYFGQEMLYTLAPVAGEAPRLGYCNFTCQALREAGQIVGISSFIFDVTEQVRARQQVEQLNQELEARVQERTQQVEAARAATERERALLQALLAQAPVAIALFQGEEARVVTANAKMTTLWGYAPEQVVGRPLLEGVPELQGQGFDDLLRQVLRTQVPVTGTEVPAVLRRGGQPQTSYYNFVYQLLYDAQGQVLGVIDVAVDVTEQVLARRQVEQLNAELETRVQARTQELREQQQLLSSILGQVPAAIATLSGPEHRFTFFNELYQELSAHRVALGRSVAEVLPEAVEQGFINLLDEVYRTGQPFIGADMPVQLHDATLGQLRQRYVDFICQPLFNDRHQVLGFLAFILDVTDKVLTRQQAAALQAELLATAQHQAAERLAFYHIFEQAPVLVALLRAPSHRFEYVNPAYQALFPGRQLVGLDMAEAVPEMATQGFTTLMDRVYQTGETYAGQEMLFAPQPAPGQPSQAAAYYNFTYQTYREHGQIVGISIFAHDVTEQVQARQAAEASARQLRLITDALPVLIGYLDREEKYRFANRAYQPWFGLAPAELLGRPIREVAGEQAYPNIRPYIVRALAGEFVEFEAEMPFRPGFTKHIRTSYIPDVQHGAVQGFYTLVADITEQVEARQQVDSLNRELAAMNEELTATNDELNQTNTQLTRTNVDLDNFIYTASHDLKQPISNIEGLLLALEHELPAAGRVGDVPLMLAMMQGAVERFTRTIAHLTDISRLQKEHAQPSQQVALAAVIEAVRLDLLPLLHDTQAQLAVDVPAELTLTFSEKNLRSVVYNLLSNALKYRHPDRGPQVRIASWQEQGYQVLEVQDNGLGLDLAQSQGRLFAMFQRLHTHVEGTGLGLYMVKKIVENAGGRIEVASQLGQGTTFRVYFLR